MTRSKHESTATSKLVNLTTKRDSVFMAFSVGVVIVPTPFWRENAVFAYPSWLRLCRVRMYVFFVKLMPRRRATELGLQAAPRNSEADRQFPTLPWCCGVQRSGFALQN